MRIQLWPWVFVLEGEQNMETVDVQINECRAKGAGVIGAVVRRFPGGRTFLKACLLSFSLLVLLPEAVRAQGTFSLVHGDWEASIFAGGSFISSRVLATPVEGSSQQTSRAVGLRYAAGAQLGARITANLWHHWGTAAEYDYSNQPMTLTNLSDSVPSLGLSHGIHRFTYDVLYYPYDRDSRLRPFVFAGPGVSLFWVKGSAKEAAAARGIRVNDAWKFTMSWGGGVKYLLRRQIAASFQFSDSISGVPGYGLPKSGSVISGEYVAGFRPDGLLNNWLISAGFLYQWEGR
jgi:opacity protein-like surface antigen